MHSPSFCAFGEVSWEQLAASVPFLCVIHSIQWLSWLLKLPKAAPTLPPLLQDMRSSTLVMAASA